MILSLHQIVNTSKSLINIMCRFLSNGESNVDESDNEFTDDSDIESDEEDLLHCMPIRLSTSDFNYRDFFMHQLLSRFLYNIRHPCVFDRDSMTVVFSLPDAAECALLFDYIYAYFGNYNVCPEVRYHDGDLVTSIHVPWLGGCIAECLLDTDGNVTNDVVCYLNSEYC